jgi:hypothetical protein
LNKNIFAALVGAVSLSGCANMMETMFYHVTLDDRAIGYIAKINAGVNLCAAENMIDRNLVYAFNSVSAQLLDITVINRPLYKSSYENYAKSFINWSESSNRLNSECTSLQSDLPKITQQMADQYMSISQRVAAGRAEERQQMAVMMSDFRNNMNQFSNSMAHMNYANKYSWPNVTFTQEKPAAVNYLVDTKKGFIQCRVTNKNFVFCM